MELEAGTATVEGLTPLPPLMFPGAADYRSLLAALFPRVAAQARLCRLQHCPDEACVSFRVSALRDYVGSIRQRWNARCKLFGGGFWTFWS